MSDLVLHFTGAFAHLNWSQSVPLKIFKGFLRERISSISEVEWAQSAAAHVALRVDLDCLLREGHALRRAGQLSLGEAARRGDLGVVLVKLRGGVDANEREKQHPKYTPLHRAVSGGHAKVVRLLLRFQADVLMRDRLGFSALHFAANQSPFLVSDLLQAHCDVNATNLQQMTPLHSAAGMGRVDICEVLLAAGAASSGGTSPADLARCAARRMSGDAREACLSLAEQLTSQNELEKPSKSVWFYESEPLERAHGAEWLPFAPEASERVEAAHLRGEEQVEILTSSSTILVDLKSRTQRNMFTGRARRVCRRAEGSVAWIPAAPGHWAGLVSTGAANDLH